MSVRRGDIVYVAVKGPYTSKPCPVVVIQATARLVELPVRPICDLRGRLGEKEGRVS